MTFLQLLPITIFSLQTGELLLTIAVAFLAGYILKALADRYLFKPKVEGAEELESEIEELREKYSAQMFKKEEDVKLLQDEVKAAEKKNLDLKIEYAKAINHIEKLKTSTVEQEADNLTPAGNVHNEVLLSLKDKIVKQEELVDELQRQLTELRDEKNELQQQYTQQAGSHEQTQTKLEQEQNELSASVTQLGNKLKEKEELLAKHEQTITSANETIEQLRNQLESTIHAGKEEANAQANRLKQEVEQLETKLQLAGESVDTKAGIEVIRTEAEQITVSIENFKQHLVSALQNTYSYEQLLNKNEKLNEVVDQLLAEKQQAENDLLAFKQQLQTEKDELTAKLQQYEQDMKQTRELLNSTISSKHQHEDQLQKQLAQKEKELQDTIHEKNNLQLNLTSSMQKLAEKEKIAKQMIEIVKEFENRILQISPEKNSLLQEKSVVVMEDGTVQYR
jgi:chromosome segregation ATPase